jgi:hypothetical protein
MFPPGRARLATKPDPIGSETNVMTIGTAPAAFLAAQVGLVPAVRMTSTFANEFVNKCDKTVLAASQERRASCRDDKIPPLHIAKFAQALPEGLHSGSIR